VIHNNITKVIHNNIIKVIHNDTSKVIANTTFRDVSYATPRVTTNYTSIMDEVEGDIFFTECVNHPNTFIQGQYVFLLY
jgi:hypothetical protein